MPTNLTIRYSRLLELLYTSHQENIASLRRVFDRDFGTQPGVRCNRKSVFPTPAEGVNALDRLFWHLTTRTTDEATNKREFESSRSIRLHWIKFLLECETNPEILVFIVEDENRVYLLDKTERYVVILEPLKKEDAYYLLTAYPMEPSSFRKIMKKFEKRGKLI